MDTAQAEIAMYEALVNFQADLPTVVKTAEAKVEHRGGGSHGYTYATLPVIIETIRPILAKHGLGFMQQPMMTPDGKFVGVQTTVVHKAGARIVFEPCLLPAGLQTPQGYGSILTYARRYSLTAALGIAADDDDDAQTAEKEKAATEASGAASRPNAPWNNRYGPAPTGGASPGGTAPDEAPRFRDPNAPATDKQRRRLHIVAREAGIEPATLKAALSNLYGTETSASLTMSQISKLMDDITEGRLTELGIEVDEGDHDYPFDDE